MYVRTDNCQLILEVLNG